MIKKIWNWFLSILGLGYKDSLENFVPKSSVKRGSDTAPVNRKPFIPRATKPCSECGKPMFVSLGQRVFTHRLCRTVWRLHHRPPKYA